MANEEVQVSIVFKTNASETTNDVNQLTGAVNNTTKATNSLNSATNSLSTSQKQNKQSIVDSTTALSLADSVSGGMVGTVTNLAKSIGILSLAQNAMTVATAAGTSATRLFTLALASTGIGLIIPAIALLVSYFSSFTPVIDLVEQGMAAFGAAVQVVQQALVKLLSGDFGGFKTLGSDIADAATEAARLTKELQDLGDEMEIQEVRNKRFINDYNTLIRQSKDLSKSEAERAKALDAAGKLAEKNQAQNLANAAKEIKLAKQQIINDANLNKQEALELERRGIAYKEFVETRTNKAEEGFERLKKAQLNYYDILGQGDKRAENAQNKQNALIEKQNTAAEKANADRIAREQKEKERKEKLETETYEFNKTAINNLNKLQIDLFQDTLTKRIAQIEEDRRLATDAENERFNNYKKNHKITEEERQRHKDTLQAIDDGAIVKTKEAETKDFEDRKKASDDYFASQAEVAIANAKADEELAATKKKINEDALAQGAQTLGVASELLGKQTDAGKAAAIAEATINTYKAATSAYSALAGIPIVGPALGGVAAGVAVAAGIANVKKIIAVKTPGSGSGSGGGTAPTTRFISSSNNQLAETLGGQTQQQTQALQQQPIKAYVTTKDINTGQELERNAVNTTTIG